VVREGGKVGQTGIGHLLGTASRGLLAYRDALRRGSAVPVYALLHGQPGAAAAPAAGRIVAQLQYTEPQLAGAVAVVHSGRMVTPRISDGVETGQELFAPLSPPAASAAAAALTALTPRSSGSASNTAAGASRQSAVLAADGLSSVTPLQGTPAWWAALASNNMQASSLSIAAAAAASQRTYSARWSEFVHPPSLLTPPNRASALVRQLMKKTKRAHALVRSQITPLGEFGDTPQTRGASTASEVQGGSALQAGYAVDYQWLRLGIRRGWLSKSAAESVQGGSGVFRVRLSLHDASVSDEGGSVAATAGVRRRWDGTLLFGAPLLLRIPADALDEEAYVRVEIVQVPLSTNRTQAKVVFQATLSLRQLPTCCTVSTVLTWEGGEGGHQCAPHGGDAALWLVAHRSAAVQGFKGGARSPADSGAVVPHRLLLLPTALDAVIDPEWTTGFEQSGGVQGGKSTEGKVGGHQARSRRASVTAASRAATNMDMTVVATPVPPALLAAAAAAVALPPSVGGTHSTSHSDENRLALGALLDQLPYSVGKVQLSSGAVAFQPRADPLPAPSKTRGGLFAAWWGAMQSPALAPQVGLLGGAVVDEDHPPLLGAFAEWAVSPRQEAAELQATGSAHSPVLPLEGGAGYLIPRCLWNDTEAEGETSPRGQGGAGGSAAGLSGWGVMVSIFVREHASLRHTGQGMAPSTVAGAVQWLLPSRCVARSLIVLTKGRAEGHAAAATAEEAAAQDAAAIAARCSTLGLTSQLSQAVLPLRAPAVGASAAAKGGAASRMDTVKAIKSTGVYPGLLSGASSTVPVFRDGVSVPNDALHVSVFAWPGWEPSMSGGVTDATAAASLGDSAQTSPRGGAVAPTKQVIRRERALASALAAEHAARADAMGPLLEGAAMCESAAEVNGATPSMPKHVLAAFDAEAKAEEAAAAAADRQKADEEAAAAAAATKQAEEEEAAAAAAAAAQEEAAAAVMQPASRASTAWSSAQGSHSADLAARSSPAPSESQTDPLPEELTRPLTARSAAALQNWDFAFERFEDPMFAAKRTVVRLLQEVERLTTALRGSGQEIFQLRNSLKSEKQRGADQAAASAGNAKLQDAATADAEDKLLRKVARAVTADRPMKTGGSKKLPHGAIGSELAREELVRAVKVLAKRLAQALARRRSAAPPAADRDARGGGRASRQFDGNFNDWESELPGATALRPVSRDSTQQTGQVRHRPPVAPVSADADYAALIRKYSHLQKAHFKQSRYIQSLQTRLSRVELLRTTVKTQESVIEKLQRWIEHRLQAKASEGGSHAQQSTCSGAIASAGSSPRVPPEEMSAILKARNLRIHVLEQQLTENATNFAAEISELKMQLMEAELAGGYSDSGSDDGGEFDASYDESPRRTGRSGRSGAPPARRRVQDDASSAGGDFSDFESTL